MSSEPTPTRRPIAAVGVSTVALLGVVAAIAVPAGAVVVSGSLAAKTMQVAVNQAGPVAKVVVADSDGSVHISGSPALSGVSGKATLNWQGLGNNHPVSLHQTLADGVLTLTKVCDGGCGGADIDIQVPPNVAVQVTTSNARIDVSNVTGQVQLNDANAEITAEQLGSGTAYLETSNARIQASFAGAPKTITAITSNAEVAITTDGRTPYYDDVRTSNGDTDTPNQNRSSDNTITVRTSNGKVTVK